MSVSANPMIPADGTIKIEDGAALSITIQYEDGDFAASNLSKDQKSVVAFKDRGKTYAVREVEDVDIDGTFTCHAIALLGDGTTAMPTDAALRLGVWAAATSMISAAQGNAYLLKVTFTAERSSFGATSDSTMVLKYCRVVVDFSEGVPGKLSLKLSAFPLSTDYLTLTG